MHHGYHILICVCILIAAGLIRIWPRTIIRCPTDTDTFFHFYLVDLIRKSRHRVPRRLDRLTLSNEMRKAYLFYWICSFVPQKWDGWLERSVSMISDCTSIIAVYFLGLHLSNVIYDTPWTAVSLYATALLAVSPGLLRLGSGPRAFQGTPRVFSQAIYTLHVAFFYFGLQINSLVLLMISVLLGSLALISSNFAIQVMLFFGVLLCLVEFSYLFIFVSSFVLSVVITKGRVLSIFKGMASHLYFYARIMQKKRLWGNQYFDKSFAQFVKGWKTSILQYKSGAGYPVLVNQFLGEQYFPFLVVFAFTPILIALMLPITDIPFDLLRFLYFVPLSALLVASLIKIKWLLFLGEGERYLEYGLPFASLGASIFLFDKGLDTLWFLLFMCSAILIPLHCGLFISRNIPFQRDYANIKKLFEQLDSLPNGNVLSVASAWLPLCLSNKPLARPLMYSLDPHILRDMLNHYGDNNSFISHRLIDMLRRYNVRYLFGMKAEMTRYFNCVTKKYKLRCLKLIYETDTALLFEVREEYRGKLHKKDVIESLTIKRQQVRSTYFPELSLSNVPERRIDNYQSLESKALQSSRVCDWVVAVETWKMIECLYPGKHLYAPIKCAVALRNLGCHDQAEIIVQEEIKKGNVLLYAMAEHAELAMARGDWAVAAKRWRDLDYDFPCQWHDLPKRLTVCKYHLAQTQPHKGHSGDEHLPSNGI